MIDYLGGWADKWLAAGDLAAEAGLDPRVDDVLRFRTSGRPDWTVVFVFNDEVVVNSRTERRQFPRSEWADRCRDHGYLVQRGKP